MTLRGRFSSLTLSIISFTHLTTSIPTNHILINHEESKNNPLLDASRYSSISEWFSAQGRILEIVNNATKECLSRFNVDEDNSVCYGDDKWEWNAVAVICVTATIAGLVVAAWLCCNWAQELILWLLSGAKDDSESSQEEQIQRSEQEDDEREGKLEQPKRKVDSVHSQDADDNSGGKMKDEGTRVDSVHSHATDDGLLAMPVLGDGAKTSPPSFQESDSNLRSLGWLL